MVATGCYIEQVLPEFAVMAIAIIMFVAFELGLGWKMGMFEKDDGPPD